ncbi:uncharacterized protein PAC_06550 [Phialocephala subalpina]|uniref:Methyltransferase type 11 domain-containing protein n=1 Tax=Phialocephala subalpina TaxID=576137 RepID=A0A1L7WV64_9HELO|nr:uncharacterized protein PAC_06550 [Phialocephala subalpina]
MVKEEDLVALAHPEYWNERYILEQKAQNGDKSVLGAYEWLSTFETLRPLLAKYLPSSSHNPHILHLGCGNSSLTADLYSLGYTNQTSIDFAPFVIDAMKAKYASLDTRWLYMDARHTSFPDASIDVAIDKSTLDAMMHGSQWDPPDDVRENVGKYVDEVGRVLKPGGQFLCITYRQPHFIKPLLRREKLWTLDLEVLSGSASFDYFVFVMKRL